MIDLMSLYQDIYGKELEKRQYFEEKSTVVFTLLAIIGSILILTYRELFMISFSDWSVRVWVSFVLALSSVVIYVFQVIYARKFMFSTKLIYLEVPVLEIFDKNKEIYDKKVNAYSDEDHENHELPEERILVGYIRDSYIRCAKNNRNINTQKRWHLIKFETFTCINLLVAIPNYVLLYFLGESSAWLMFT